MVTLQKITWDNWEECMSLDVAEEQDDFIASNRYSLAQSYVALLNDEQPPMTFAIYNNDTMVGFLMMGYSTAEESEYGNEAYYDLARFMIDKKFQNKGLGKQAMEKLMEYIRTFPQGEATAIYLAYGIKNNLARKFYQSLGFVETGGLYIGDDYVESGGTYTEEEDVEVVAKLVL